MLEQHLDQSMVNLDQKRWLMLAQLLTLRFLVLTALALVGPSMWRLVQPGSGRIIAKSRETSL
ncbi:MAG: hypothetical protein OXL68_09175 [Paracoccaceae bacterium]|nr:hypothetical protein [Paracoccaceae bacterium]